MCDIIYKKLVIVWDNIYEIGGHCVGYYIQNIGHCVGYYIQKAGHCV